jgi:hypothetical protein
VEVANWPAIGFGQNNAADQASRDIPDGPQKNQAKDLRSTRTHNRQLAVIGHNNVLSIGSPPGQNSFANACDTTSPACPARDR